MILAWSAKPLPPPQAVVSVPAVAPPAPRAPLHAHARPFDISDNRPRVALILSNETDHTAAQMTASLALPGDVTLAFTPYTRGLSSWVERARQDGHEVLIGIPMEPYDLSVSDPGPLALLTEAEPAANRERLQSILKSAAGYVGVFPIAGGRMLASSEKLRPVLEELNRHGVLLLDTSGPAQTGVRDAGVALPQVKVDQLIVGDTREEIERRLRELEGAAVRSGRAVGLATTSPAVVDQIAAWASGLQSRGVALAPVTAMLAQ